MLRRPQPASKRALADALRALDEIIAPPSHVLESVAGGGDDTDEGDAKEAGENQSHQRNASDEWCVPSRRSSSSAAMVRGGSGDQRGTCSSLATSLLDEDASPPAKQMRPDMLMTVAEQPKQRGGSKSASQKAHGPDVGGGSGSTAPSLLDLHHRRTEDEADATTYLADALPRAVNGHPLRELLAHLSRNEGALGAVRKLGSSAPLVEACVAKPHTFTTTTRVAHLVLLRLLASALPHEFATSERGMATLLDLLKDQCPSGGSAGLGCCNNSPTPPAALPPSPVPAQHWSARVSAAATAKQRPHRAGPPRPVAEAATQSQADPDLAAVAARVGGLEMASIEAPRLVSELFIDTLMQTMLTHNSADDSARLQHQHSFTAEPSTAEMLRGDGAPAAGASVHSPLSPRSPSVIGSLPPAVRLLRAGGFDALFAMLQTAVAAADRGEADVGFCRRVTQLLDIATCCAALRGGVSAPPESTFEHLLLYLVHTAAELPAGLTPDDGSAFLRIAMNITTLWPTAAPAGQTQIAAFAGKVVAVMDGHAEESDSIVCAACLLINMLRDGANAHLRWALLKNESWLIRIARLVRTFHAHENSVENVTAGYLSMVLGMLSLDDEDARVAVITALARAYNEEAQVLRRPMLVVVAIMQEFVMFQSAAGILTRDALVSMHGVIEKLVMQNGIDISGGDGGGNRQGSD